MFNVSHETQEMWKMLDQPNITLAHCVTCKMVGKPNVTLAQSTHHTRCNIGLAMKHFV